MTIQKLYQELIEAYSDKHLNAITGKLIALYKNKNFDKIRTIANKVSKYIPMDEEKDAKCFSRLIVLYHPDRGELHRKNIQQYYEENNLEALTGYSHILELNDVENTVVTTVDESVDYNPQYTWDAQEKEGYYGYDEDENQSKNRYDPEFYEKSFYNEVKYRQYGDLSIDFPPHYLEDFEAFELAESEIDSLDGIEYCKHAVTMDLSDNHITDISAMAKLDRLEELYLAHNQIGYIDALSNLQRLKKVDLSHNQIDDISPLLELDDLEYVNILGNPIPESQIKKLKDKNVLVLH